MAPMPHYTGGFGTLHIPQCPPDKPPRSDNKAVLNIQIIMGKHTVQIVRRTMRLPFLIMTPVCIFLGYCTSVASQSTASSYDLIIVLLGAMAAHISVNIFNEYFDFKSGLDTMTVKTPFSGGSGALVDSPETANIVFYLAIAFLCITTLVGIYFIYRNGPAIIPIGVLGIAIILTYTPWLNRQPWLCLVAPGIGFGPLMVIGTHFVLSGEYSMNSFFISLVPFFLANNLLLLNQYPDISADRSVGRRHFPIAYGVTNSTLVYGFFALAATLVVVIGILLEYLPKICLISLVPLSVSIGVFFGTMKYANSVERLLPYLRMNALTAVLTPVVLGIAILSG